MHPVTGSAPGKIILFGEHAVVYGQPAIAIPISQLRAKATIEAGTQPGILLKAPDLGVQYWLREAAVDDAFAKTLQLIRETASLDHLPDIIVTISSQIPVASGLGSGAAITAAIIKAVASYLDKQHLFPTVKVSELTYEVERIHHGTPSGIDNTVVTYEAPIFFIRRHPENHVETFSPHVPLNFLIADSGKSSSTKAVVGDVRQQWEMKRKQFETLFDGCGRITTLGRQAIELGDLPAIGRLMVNNHILLKDMTVSSPELDDLVAAALDAGALGAKLSGAGRGGNVISLVTAETKSAVQEAFLKAGAVAVRATVLESQN